MSLSSVFNPNVSSMYSMSSPLSNHSIPSIAEDLIQLMERIKMGNILVSAEEEVLAKAYVSVGLGESMIAAILNELNTKNVDANKNTFEVKPAPCPTKVLIAHNIPRDVSHEDLRHTFENYGPIRDIYIPKNMDKTSPYYGTIKGFALIKFLSLKDAIAAYNAEFGRLYMGFRLVSIEYAKEGR
jgi:FUS-interacting serine-arginine-rich protein 1